MKKKIFLNGRFLSQTITGVQRTAYELVKALDELIDKKLIDTNQYEYILIHPKIKKESIYLKHIKLLKKGWLQGNLWEQIELPYHTTKHLLVSMCMVSTLFKRNQIVIIHDASVFVNPDFFSKKFRTWYKFALTHLGKIAIHIVTVSEFSKKELVKNAKILPSKISVIPNAANHILKFAEPAEDFKKKVGELKPFLLAVSSLAANKNFDGLSKAIANINLNGYKVLIAGGVQKTLKEVVKSNAAVYLNYVSDEELRYLYSSASLFIFPSFYEGFGIPPLEAMISGCPVLSSNTSALPEVLGDACAFCNPNSVEDMTHAIQELFGDKTRLADLKQRGYLQAGKYSWEKSAKMLSTIVEKYSK